MIRAAHTLNLLLVLMCASVPGMSNEFPSDSIYRLNVLLTTQEGRTAPLSSFSGHIRIVTMLYTSCSYVCPMTVQSLKDLEATLSEQERSRLRILLVSIDSQRDSANALAAFAAKHELNLKRWSLARPTTNDVRKIAAVLDIQYRQLTNKEFNHSTILALVSPNGRIIAKANSKDSTDAQFNAVLRKALASH